MTLHVIVVLTKGQGLSTWRDAGTLSRELALYQYLAKLEGIGTTFVSWSAEDESQMLETYPSMNVVNCPGGKVDAAFISTLRTVVGDARMGRTLIKTNQVMGGDVAIEVASRLNRPLVARAGYLPSEFYAESRLPYLFSLPRVRRAERRLFDQADIVLTTTQRQAIVIAERYSSKKDVQVVPNYVDTDLFCPAPKRARKGIVGSVGRLHRQKNFGLLIGAAESTGLQVKVVGEGPEKSALQQKAARSRVDLTLRGSLEHRFLPSFLQQIDVFALPSLYEGHPKALIEAMACGVPVVAADVNGIRDVLRNGSTGVLFNGSLLALRRALLDLTTDVAAAREIGSQAREFAVTNYSLATVARLEIAAYSMVCT